MKKFFLQHLYYLSRCVCACVRAKVINTVLYGFKENRNHDDDANHNINIAVYLPSVDSENHIDLTAHLFGSWLFTIVGWRFKTELWHFSWKKIKLTAKPTNLSRARPVVLFFAQWNSKKKIYQILLWFWWRFISGLRLISIFNISNFFWT